MDALNTVLSKIKPDEAARKKVLDVANAFLAELGLKIKDAELILGGSIAKGTWLVDDKLDVDVFVAFDYEKYKDMSDTLANELEKSLVGAERFHGSRDYFQVVKDEILFELIPILNIKDSTEALNITDVSPLHSGWVVSKSNDSMRDEIRLTKAFCKAHRMYGAESYIKGFSGYVLEILTITSGGFLKLMKAASKWKSQVVIDVEKHHKHIEFEVDASKLQGPLVVIDPVQPGRNAAAALGFEVFEKFVALAKKCSKNPSEEMFDREVIDIEGLRAKGALVFTGVAQEGKQDIIGCKLEKVYEQMLLLCKQHEFEIVNSDWDWNEEAVFVLEFASKELPKQRKVTGPPSEMEKNVTAFKGKYSDAYEENGQWFAIVDREIRSVSDLAEVIVNDKRIKENIQSLSYD